MTKQIFALPLALVAIAACDPEDATETSSAAVRRGSLTTEAPWNVRIDFPWGRSCSGNVLTEHWILTAAHCMAGREAVGQASVSWADIPGGVAPLYSGQARFYPNDAYQGSLHTANDVGLVRVVDRAMDLGKTGRAKLWSPVTRPWASGNVADRIFFAMGWGKTGDNCQNGPGKKFISGQSLLDRAGWNDTKVTTPTSMPAVCEGDSGSGWLFRRNGQLIAFAITSRYIPWPFEWDEAPLIWPYNEPWISIVSLRDGLQVTCRDAGFAGADTFQECIETPVTHPPPPGHGGTVCPIGKHCCDPNPDGPKCLFCIANNRQCE
jgi:hypothetical protein